MFLLVNSNVVPHVKPGSAHLFSFSVDSSQQSFLMFQHHSSRFHAGSSVYRVVLPSHNGLEFSNLILVTLDGKVLEEGSFDCSIDPLDQAGFENAVRGVHVDPTFLHQ